MGTGIYLHLDGPAKVESWEISAGKMDVLKIVDAESDLSIYLGRTDEIVVENALLLIEAVEDIRERALRRMALRNIDEMLFVQPDPITAAKAEADRTNMDVEPDGNEPDGPGDAYWQSGGPVHESATYRRDMADAGRGAKVRA